MHTKRRVFRGQKVYYGKSLEQVITSLVTDRLLLFRNSRARRIYSLRSREQTVISIPKLVKFAGLSRFWCCEANL